MDGKVRSRHMASVITGFQVTRFFIVELRAKEPSMRVRGRWLTQMVDQCICRSRGGLERLESVIGYISGMSRKESTWTFTDCNFRVRFNISELFL